MVELLPSILSADFAHLADEVAAAERGGGTVIHVDVMDGHFVPNITMGRWWRACARHNLPLDCHLMIENPDDFIPAFAERARTGSASTMRLVHTLHRSLELFAPWHEAGGGAESGHAGGADQRDPAHGASRADHECEPGVRGQEFIPFSLEKIRGWSSYARARGWHLRSRLTAAWLTTRSPRSSKRERSCWLPVTRCFGAGERGARRACRCWRRPGKPQA